MACIRKRRGKYVVDYRDGAGIRRWVTCETRREAETVLLDKAREARQPTRPVVDPNITMSAYAERWLQEIAVTIKPKTQKSYGSALRLHILPALGSTKVRMLQKGRIKSFLVERLQQGKVRTITESEVTKEVRLPLARDSVRIIHATLRALPCGRIEKPKSGHGRTVDTSEQLARILLQHQIKRKTETLKRGWSRMPEWVFCTETGTLPDESRVRKIMRKTLKAARLPLHFSPHCLRHTFAILLLQQGESPAYVQRQLGHASIQLTVDTYGKWLPMGNKAAVNRLDDESGSKNGDGHFRCSGSARHDWWAVTDSNRGPAD